MKPKSRKKRKRARKKSKTKVILAITVGVIIVLSVTVALYLNQLSSVEYPAKEYFQVVGSTVDDGEFVEYPKVLFIHAISFNITAVKGDAHGVVISSPAMSEAEVLGDMLQGQIVYVNVQFGGRYLRTFNEEEGGYPVDITIRSKEAFGELTFYIPLE